MYLSKLEIFGFKSFAKRTSFFFKGGITSIVGPNGCGKSNVVDAIRWVLGEQKAGVLRSEKMDNVIFNGSKSQKPLGMAEVAMTIENTRGILPLEYSEVVITRRLFRSGESQYLLNNTICRLKDILNLFMDTGMGANAYSVIELPMVEQILNGKAEERRHIFEEAAGVGKYKARRKAAFRKLEATESDVTRLNDVLSEVEKNVETLKRQVQKAQRYQSYTDELKTTELNLASHQFSNVINQLEPLVAESKELKDKREHLSAQVATEEAEVEELRLKILELEKQLVSRQRELNDNTERIQKKEEEILVNQERARAVKENRIRYAQEIEELKQRKQMLAEMHVSLKNTLDATKLNLENLEAEFADKQKELETQRQAYQGKRQEFRAVEANRAAENEVITTLQKENERFQTQLEYSTQRNSQIINEKKSLEQQKTEVEKLCTDISEQLTQTLAQLDELNIQSEKLQEETIQKNTDVEDLKQKIIDKTNTMQRHKDRVGLLRKVLESYEDYPEGVKHLLLEGGLTEGCLGTLGDKIKVHPKYQRAIEAVLGDSIVTLLVDKPEHAFAGIDLLQQSKKGVVSFLPVSNNSEVTAYHNFEDLTISDERIINKIANLIECEPELKRFVNNALGNCYLVNTLSDAQTLAQQHETARLCFVTIDGNFITNWGPIRGGKSNDDGHSILGRRQELETLEDEIEKLDFDIDDLITIRERIEGELRSLSDRNEQFNRQRKSIETERQNLEIEFGKTAFRTTKANEDLEQKDSELKRLKETEEQIKTKLSELDPQLLEYQSKRQAAEDSHTELYTEIDTIEKEVSKAEQKANEANMQVVEVRAEIRNIESEMNRSQKSVQETDETIQMRTEQITDAEAQGKNLNEQNDAVRLQMETTFADQQELEKRVHEIEGIFQEQKNIVEAKEKKIRPARNEREEISEKLHEAELRISELSGQRDNVVKYIHETFELELVKYLDENPIDSDDDFDSDAAQERVNWIRQRLKSMGLVNMLALSDFDKEKERYDFLLSQKDDLISAEVTLKETIKVINDTAYEQFGMVFSQIRENFIQVFKSFFTDGIADLRLAEGDPLESDIVIEANPKGRKLGSLALLSGGEKTLTAISLLFAIYLVKPSPFCILDEVDAPLDDSNVKRFAEAIRKFSENTQFICVTHNKGTMREADYLYGVTMEEHGISKVVSVNFQDTEPQKILSTKIPSTPELN